jgi:hypothetical protein
MVGKSKNRRRSAERFKTFPQLLWCKQKHSASEKRDGNSLDFANLKIVKTTAPPLLGQIYTST